MSKVVSEDSVRRSFGNMDESEGVAWLQDSIHSVYAPLLSVPWILDADTTINCGAVDNTPALVPNFELGPGQVPQRASVTGAGYPAGTVIA